MLQYHHLSVPGEDAKLCFCKNNKRMIINPSRFGSQVKKILNDDETMPDLTNPACAYVAADATVDGHCYDI